MSKKDYSLKFYKGSMINENDERYNFYLAARSENEAEDFIRNHIYSNKSRYHIIPNENDISDISVVEVSIENYGKSYGYEVIN